MTITLGDLNGDGFDEVAATEPQSLSRVIVYSGGDGSVFWHANQLGLSFGQSVAPIDDLSGDAAPDVLCVSVSHLRAYRGADGSMMFQLDFETPDQFRSVISVGDVTGDGAPDFAIGNPSYPPEEDDSDPETINFGRVTLYCGRTHQQVRVYNGPSPHAMMGHHLAVMHNADGAGATAVVARAHRKGDDPDVNGVYAYAFIAPTPCHGDTNFDRVINKADFAAVLAQYGDTGPRSGDLNSDGVVDFADFSIVLSRYGATCD